MRIAIPIMLIAAGCSAQQSVGSSPTTAPAAAGETVTIMLSNFAFDPDHIRLRVGQPVRLHLVNETNGGHNFSASAFFAASGFPPGSSPPPDGTVEVASHQTRDIVLTPRQPGTYQLKCTHTLHDLFGMTGGIEVIP